MLTKGKKEKKEQWEKDHESIQELNKLWEQYGEIRNKLVFHNFPECPDDRESGIRTLQKRIRKHHQIGWDEFHNISTILHGLKDEKKDYLKDWKDDIDEETEMPRIKKFQKSSWGRHGMGCFGYKLKWNEQFRDWNYIDPDSSDDDEKPRKKKRKYMKEKK